MDAPKEERILRVVVSCEGWWLAWGVNRGLPLWIPDEVQESIVKFWNPIVCFFRGHRAVGLSISGPKRCTHCTHCCAEITECPVCKWKETK